MSLHSARNRLSGGSETGRDVLARGLHLQPSCPPDALTGRSLGAHIIHTAVSFVTSPVQLASF